MVMQSLGRAEQSKAAQSRAENQETLKSKTNRFLTPMETQNQAEQSRPDHKIKKTLKLRTGRAQQRRKKRRHSKSIKLKAWAQQCGAENPEHL
jgi:hypothetical protein